jgi:hypothetical protein
VGRDDIKDLAFTKIDQMYLVADDKDAFVSTKGVFRSSTKSKLIYVITYKTRDFAAIIVFRRKVSALYGCVRLPQ